MYYNEVTQIITVHQNDAIYQKIPLEFSFLTKTDQAIQFSSHNLITVLDQLINNTPFKNRHMLYNIAQLLIFQLKSQNKYDQYKDVSSIINIQKLIHHLQDDMDPDNVLSSPEWSENSPIAAPLKYDPQFPEKCFDELLLILNNLLFEKSDKIESLIERTNTLIKQPAPVKTPSCLSRICCCFGMFNNQEESRSLIETSPTYVDSNERTNNNYFGNK